MAMAMAGAGTVGLVLMLCIGASAARSISIPEEGAEQGTWVFTPGDARPHSSRLLGEQGTWALLNIAPDETEEAGDRVILDTVDVVQGKKGRKWAVVAGVVVAAAAGVAVVMMVYPAVVVCVVRTLGFTAQGIAAGSRAAFIMSLYAGRVTVGSVCAICQSIGALGVAGVTAIFNCCTFIVVSLVLSLLTIGLVCYFHPALVKDLFHRYHLGSFFKELGNTIVDLFDHLGSFFKELGNTILERLRSL